MDKVNDFFFQENKNLLDEFEKMSGHERQFLLIVLVRTLFINNSSSWDFLEYFSKAIIIVDEI